MKSECKYAHECRYQRYVDGTVSPIYDDDRWVIINQPKIEKDGDSD